MSKRPFLVTLMTVVVLLLASVNLARAAIGIARWPVFGALPDTLPTLVSIGLGTVWGVTWLAEGWGLWTLRSWARPTGIALFVLYQIAILGEQVAFDSGPYERGLLPGNIITSILLAGLVAFALTRPTIRRAFRPPHEES